MLDYLFIDALLKKPEKLKEYKPLITKTSEWFDDPKVILIWDFLIKFKNDFGNLPDKSTLSGKFEQEIPESVEPIDFYFSQVRQRFAHNQMNLLAMDVDRLMKQDKSIDAIKLVKSRVTEIESKSFITTRVKEINQLGEKLWEEYLNTKAGVRGIPVPSQMLDDWTMGWYPKDTSYIVARGGVGKTWLTLLMAIHAIRNGVNTTYISCEMSDTDIARRAYSMHTKIPYGILRKGRLSSEQEFYVKESLGNIDMGAKFHIHDGATGLSMNEVEDTIASLDNPFVVIDAAYRIKSRVRAKDRFENMANVADELKAIAQQYNKALLCSIQLNRGSAQKSAEDLSTDDIAFSDVIGMVATNIFGIKREKDLPVMNVSPMKVREAAKSGEILRLNWNFLTMDFSEIRKEDPQNPAIDEDTW